MRRVMFAIVAFFLLLGPASLSSDLTSEVIWTEKPTAALAASSATSRPVVVDYWATWCEPCKEMDRTTYRDPRVVDAMNGFVPLKVNVDKNEMFAERYSVEAYPTLLFLDENGSEITRLAGMIEAAELLETMQRVGNGYAAYVANLSARDDVDSIRAASNYLLAAGNGDGAARLLRSALKVAKKNDPDAADSIELDLSRVLLAEGRVAIAAKTLERLAKAASSAETRARALAKLALAERKRGREDKADDALARLAREYPTIAGELSNER